MTGILAWFLSLVLFPPEEREMTERFAPPGFVGHYWGPEATEAREEGKLPPVLMTPEMVRWDRWGQQYLRDGDIVFRMGDARLLHGYFPMSRFLANCSNSPFSHTGIVAIEKGQTVVYDVTRPAVARQPFCVWMQDCVGNFGVKRLKPSYRGAIPQVVAYCQRAFQEKVPFDYELGLDDSHLYCIELTLKAYRSAGIVLCKPIALGDMERAPEYPLCMYGLRFAAKLNQEHPIDFDSLVYFPGNERHGIWSAPQLMTVVPPTYCPGYPGLSTGLLPVPVAVEDQDEPKTRKVSTPSPHARPTETRRSGA